MDLQQHTLATPYLIGEVHCYSTRINGELVLFDSGPPTTEALAALKAQLDLSCLKYIFLTHSHIDHIGLASMLADQSDATILIPRADAIKISRYADSQDHLVRLLAEFGCDARTAESIRQKPGHEKFFEQLWGKFQIVEESDIPSRLGITWLSCPGHSQSDLVYFYGQHAITGDTLLRNIFQVPILEVNLETFAGRFHNYSAYCSSIKSLARLRDRIIHPGHRWQVDNLDTTILFYLKRLLKLTAKISASIGRQTPAEITASLLGPAKDNPFFFHMKLSEIIFAMDFSEAPHQLKRALEEIGLFEEIAEQFDAVFEPEELLYHCSP